MVPLQPLGEKRWDRRTYGDRTGSGRRPVRPLVGRPVPRARHKADSRCSGFRGTGPGIGRDTSRERPVPVVHVPLQDPEELRNQPIAAQGGV